MKYPRPTAFTCTSRLSGLTKQGVYSDGTLIIISTFKIIAWNCSNVLIKSFLFTSAKLFTLQLYEFAGFWMQCNSMFVTAVSYSGIFGLSHIPPQFNIKEAMVFIEYKTPYVCWKQQYIACTCICWQMFFSMGSRKKNPVRVHSWNPAVRMPAFSYYRQ